MKAMNMMILCKDQMENESAKDLKKYDFFNYKAMFRSYSLQIVQNIINKKICLLYLIQKIH